MNLKLKNLIEAIEANTIIVNVARENEPVEMAPVVRIEYIATEISEAQSIVTRKIIESEPKC